MDYEAAKYYISKQFGWVEFNKRVLEEAGDNSNPLLERLKFLAIVASNLDEFMRVRIARLKDQIESGYGRSDKAGLTPKQLYSKLSDKIHQLVTRQYRCLDDILSKLKEENIFFINYEELNSVEQEYLTNYFEDTIYPMLTSLAVDQSGPFPFILNNSLNLGVHLKSANRKKIFINEEREKLFSVVQVPSELPRIIEVPSEADKRKFIFIEEIIKKHLSKLFSEYEIKSVDVFKVSRNAEVSLDEEAKNLLLEMEKYLQRREVGFPIRLEIKEEADEDLKKFLVEVLDLEEEAIYEIAGPIDLTSFREFSDLEGFDHLQFEPLVPQPAKNFYGADSIFDAIRKEDKLIHLPYESFHPVVKMIKEAAVDPQVLAIKQTLYRISGDSPIIKALAKAAKDGKQVTVLVELKARFDEKNNIQWAKTLEEAGCDVVYGLLGLKVHAKLLLVVRQEKDKIRRYIHMSTGNYNDKTAKLYTDIGMFTCKDAFGEDVSLLFNLLTGCSVLPEWHKLSIAPFNLRDTFIRWIKNEINQVRRGKQGHIIAKMNALVDKEIIQELYKASAEGVKIDLIVRGMCCLRPQIKGVSENIRVISIVGRLLEHSRIYYFSNGGDEKIFLSSADWRPRNLDRRVEALFPVEQTNLKKRIKKLLSITLQDTVKAREQQLDGSYKRVNQAGKLKLNSQLKLYQLAIQRIKEIKVERNI